MEQKNVLLSALGVGVGLGVWLGLASGQTMNKWTRNNSASSNGVTAEKMEQELLRQVVEGRESKITFDEFPYYLSILGALVAPEHEEMIENSENWYKPLGAL
ncbi:hypothetical protein Q3G72_034680 [Acer saccharum]|nr:hypothetical protein Q3G72_034680 [Acer saccharum]